MERVTMADVANKANVSKSTVSQYINNRFEYMSLETKKRIECAIEELNYQPNIIARSLKQKKTYTIGVIVANILHTFSTQVIRAIEDECQRKNVNVIVCNADDQPSKERKYIETLRAKQVDGLIIFPTGGNLDLYKKLEKSGYPLVFVDRTVENTDITSVLLDNEKASSLAVDHLVGKGYRNIAFLTTSIEMNITPRIERMDGFKKALQKHNLPLLEQLFAGEEIHKMQEKMHFMFSQDKVPDAIICGNDLTLLEVLKFCRKKALTIPTDVALVSIDEVSFSEIYNPPITVVTQPSYEIGTYAAQQLLQKADEHEKTEETIIRFEPKLVVRSST
ncbi:substrate-binding domain-containing protein [Viridibacillus arvi]|jgi:LacI family kdg operon repressor|uniref:LacI family transcriptional regulator n=1 Tax=Viridibacillus arvi TaxID=263475 RepID=A0A0M0LGA7_9BACL|nr:substrate-binding domain-containing protein [Viridibacillus arvi]KOO49986.1 LacI family transcriptional regulator [Viridibacillus arvi]